MDHLASKGIWSCGTVRTQGLPGVAKGKQVDKTLDKKGRESYEELVCKQSNCEISYVKWHDNKIVNIVSNFARASPVTTVERYDKKTGKVVDVTCPDIIQKYYKCMGGVDLADGLIALYRISLRYKKFYMRLVFHMFDMSIKHSSKLHGRDAERLNLQRKDILPLPTSNYRLLVH
jgi:hypothetical protein